MLDKKDPFVSLRADMGHALWTGIQLRPETDIQFRLDPFSNGCRLIRLRLVKRDGRTALFTTGSSFEMSALGKDFERLETLAADLIAITRCVTSIRSSMASHNDMLLAISIMDDEQLFRLYANEPGQSRIERWDWFANPDQPSSAYGDIPIHVPRLVADLSQQAAA